VVKYLLGTIIKKVMCQGETHLRPQS